MKTCISCVLPYRCVCPDIQQQRWVQRNSLLKIEVNSIPKQNKEMWCLSSSIHSLFCAFSSQVSCELNFSSSEQSKLLVILSLGVVIGNCIWGSVSDSYGRKYGLGIPMFIAGFGGFLFIFTTGYWVSRTEYCESSSKSAPYLIPRVQRLVQAPESWNNIPPVLCPSMRNNLRLCGCMADASFYHSHCRIGDWQLGIDPCLCCRVSAIKEERTGIGYFICILAYRSHTNAPHSMVNTTKLWTTHHGCCSS